MKEQICQRVEALRGFMRKHNLGAYIFPSTDPHSGEYIPDHWMSRQWISGFNGSAGTAVVALDDAALWTDSRYFLAAAEQLDGTPFKLMKMALADTPSIAQWLAKVLPAGSSVGMDGWVNTIDSVKAMKEELEFEGLNLVMGNDPTDELWEGRPAIPMSPAEIQPIELAGEDAKSKLARLREGMAALHTHGTVVSQLDEIAWLTNLRGTDVHCTPVVVSYMTVTPDTATLYIHKEKMTDEVAAYLQGQGIGVKAYGDLLSDLENYTYPTLLIDPAWSNYELTAHLPSTCRVVEHKSLIAPMRAIKNEAEIAGYHSAMKKDGVALVKFLRWLKPAVEAGGQTECSIDRKLTSLRAEQPLYRDISFDTIAGYGYHGAIVHYEPTAETDIPVEPKGFLLLDSGAQYQDGTTDITRTIALGPLTEEERHDYTLVLRGHIRLAMVKFPSGSSGTQLDVCARYAMWQEGKNYLHGTGHGVGSYLSVHEGPHQFRMNWMPAPLVANMTVTDEPGIYITGKHGCRTENTMLIKHYMDGEFGEFLEMEPLTLCPIDLTPVNFDEMQQDEIDYLNWYHGYVREQLLPLLDDEADREWLIEATKEVK